MAKSLVLHIGDPKTGSSSIQEVLRNRLYQATGVSVDYPDQLNSFPLANALSDPKQAEQRAPRYTRLAEWLSRSEADVAIVSAEQFFRVDPQVLLDTLNEFLPAYVPTLRIVAYVRPHASRLVSAFMQRTKAGLYQGDMETFFERTQGENLLRFAPRFALWRAAFGDRFILRPMIRDQLRDGDVVADFLNIALNGAPFTLKGTVEANTSLPLEHLAGLREVQAVLKRNTIPGGTRHSVGDHVNRTLARLKPATGTRLQMSEALYQDVRAFCQSDAEALDEVFFDGPLMVQELEQAKADTAAINQDTMARVHFSEETVLDLRKSARTLVAMFKKRPIAWTVAFEREIGQRMEAENAKPPPPPVRAHIEKVNGVLTKIASVIAKGGQNATE